ncbi:MAG: flagellar filament capping protein FliD [Methylococcales bacterium]|nr:flagellar filament capping protein FliD [Methylococcales bacterium]
MAGIQVGGIGSGLDVNSIVNQLMALERQPLTKLNTKKTQYQAQVSAYGSLTSKLSEFSSKMSELSSEDKFKIFTTSSSNSDAFSASADSEANKGSYSVNITQLASTHKIASTTAASGEVIASSAGSLTITVGSATASITIDADSTMSDIRDAINTDSNNPDVTATILTDNDGNQRLILTSDNSGSDNKITVATSDSDLDRFVYDPASPNSGSPSSTNMGRIDEGLNASATIDGFTISSSSNQFKDNIQGVTLTASEVGSGTLTLARDDASITSSLTYFASIYNELRDTIDSLRSGHLEADGTLLAVESMILKEIGTEAVISGNTYTYMSQVGLSLDSDGQLQVSSSDLTDALDEDFDGVAKLFAEDDQGFAFRLNSLVSGIIAGGGIIEARTDGLDDTITSIESQITEKERLLISTEERIRAQFTAMDQLVSSLNQTSSYLVSQLG